MNKNEEIEKLKSALVKKIKSENDSRYKDMSSDEIMKIITASSLNGKYVLWVLREYLKGNIQKFEDIESRCKQALILFKNNLSKFTEQQKQLNKMSFQELESLVEPYQEVLTQNAVKRMNKEKIWTEIDVIYEGPEGRIYVPKTEQAAIFLGQGTKWCTAAVNNNMFEYYNNQGPLYIFVLPEKGDEGREIKYQLQFETKQFMDTNDKPQNITDCEKNCNLRYLLHKLMSVKKDSRNLIEKLMGEKEINFIYFHRDIFSRNFTGFLYLFVWMFFIVNSSVLQTVQTVYSDFIMQFVYLIMEKEAKILIEIKAIVQLFLILGTFLIPVLIRKSIFINGLLLLVSLEAVLTTKKHVLLPEDISFYVLTYSLISIATILLSNHIKIQICKEIISKK